MSGALGQNICWSVVFTPHQVGSIDVSTPVINRVFILSNTLITFLCNLLLIDCIEVKPLIQYRSGGITLLLIAWKIITWVDYRWGFTVSVFYTLKKIKIVIGLVNKEHQYFLINHLYIEQQNWQIVWSGIFPLTCDASTSLLDHWPSNEVFK